MITTRCKYYVSNVESQKPQGQGDTLPWKTINFNAAYSQDKKTENYEFWAASPSGKMSITCAVDDMPELVPGTYVYIDIAMIEGLTEDEAKDAIKEPDVWRLWSLARPWGSQLQVGLKREETGLFNRGSFEVSIDNKVVWPLFTELDALYRMKITITDK